MNSIRLNAWVEGDPRPYNGAKTGNATHYIPQPVRDWQQAVGIAIKNAIQHSTWTCSPGRVRVDLAFYLPDYHTRDLDNLEKSTIDAIKGHAFDDDDQVVEKHSAKYFLPELPSDMKPGATITITELTPTHQTRQIKRRKPKP